MAAPTNPRITNPARVVDANRFAGQFASQMPPNPIDAAPSSPRVGYGEVATVPSTAGTQNTNPPEIGEAPSSPEVNLQSAANPVAQSTGVVVDGMK
jgi:hypothetical protein